jgi:aspartate kinase
LLPQPHLDVMSEVINISVIGPSMVVQSGVVTQVSEVVTSQGISLKAVTTSEIKICYVISQKNRMAIEAIKTTFGI